MDLTNEMTYNLRGSWEGFTGKNSPLFAGPNDQGDCKFFNVVSDEMDSGQPVLLGLFEACHGTSGQGRLMDRKKMAAFPNPGGVPCFPVLVTDCIHLSFAPEKAGEWLGS